MSVAGVELPRPAFDAPSIQWARYFVASAFLKPAKRRRKAAGDLSEVVVLCLAIKAKAAGALTTAGHTYLVIRGEDYVTALQEFTGRRVEDSAFESALRVLAFPQIDEATSAAYRAAAQGLMQAQISPEGRPNESHP